MNDKPRYIYALVDPDTGDIRYVGNSQDPFKRLISHMVGSHGTSKKKEWIEELKKQGKRPELILLDVCYQWFESFHRERDWIISLRHEGHPLTNKFCLGHYIHPGVLREYA